MTSEEATALVQFIKDHDTRFVATAVTDSAECSVELRQPEDGSELEPVRSLDEYAARYIEGNNPGPTIKGAWERWRSELPG